jgi:hypothetical protein
VEGAVGPGQSGDPNPIMATFGRPVPQRRWTVLLRVILVVPQAVVLLFVGVAAFCVVVFGWFASLVLGRFPEPAARFVVQYLRWNLRVTAYLYLMTDRYPPFHGDDDPAYPVRMAADPGPLNRLAVLFRIVLGLPAWALSILLGEGLGAFSVVTWVLTLVLGRIPEPIFEASAMVLRFSARVNGYLSLVTSEWPWGSFGDRAEPGELVGFGGPAYPPAGWYPPAGSPSSWAPPPYGAPPAVPPYGAPPAVPPYGAPPAVPPYGAPPAVPPYGAPPAPPPYGAPPAVPPQGAMPLPPPVSRANEAVVYRQAGAWRLVASSGAKVLLVVFLLIGGYLEITSITASRTTTATTSSAQPMAGEAPGIIAGATGGSPAAASRGGPDRR